MEILMNKRILDIRKLNEEGFAYLREVFSDPRFEGDDYDSFYAYLSYLDDTEVLITNYGDMSDFCHDLKTLQRRQRRLRQHLSGLCRYKPAGDRKKDRHGHQGTQRQRSPVSEGTL